MAVHIEETQEVSRGLAKELDQAALPMIFDNLQKHQYQYPIKSTIRELVSNAVDAMREKKVAIDILTGVAKEEDYYLRRDEPMFKDSNFNPYYYDLEYLNTVEIPVRIIHEYGDSSTTRDLLHIIDDGVGLGPVPNPETGVSRLEGIFKLGYSSKRNTSIALGKWGIGAKSALSTGTDYYTMITRYNGWEYQFNIYSHKVDSMIPHWDMESGTENTLFIFNEGTEKEFRGYCRKTDRLNGTEIQVPTKKMHRQSYIDAVKSQLLYFDNVRFSILHEDRTLQPIPFKSEILYEDENLIIPDNNQFSKPHLVLNGVNYGYIDFAELELEEIQGNVAFKINPERVEINPSRESLIWMGKTKDTILEVIKGASDTAGKIIQERLKEDDFIKWLRTASTLISHSTHDPILKRMGGLIDRSKLKLVYEKNPLIKMTGKSYIFEGITMTSVQRENYFDKALQAQRYKPSRSDASISEITSLPIYIQRERTLPSRDQYLLNKHPNGYIKVRVMQPGTEKADELFATVSKRGKEFATKWNDRRKAVYQLLTTHPASMNYEDILVPKEVEEDLAKQEEAAKIAEMSPEELRKINEQIVVQACSKNWFVKHEPKIKDVLEDEGLIVYGFMDDKPLLKLVSELLKIDSNSLAYCEDFKLVLVSKQNAKYFRRHTHVQDFIRYYDHSTKTIGMHNKIVNTQTARKISEVSKKLDFLDYFKPFNSTIYQIWMELKEYKRIHLSTSTNAKEMEDYADKVIELQLFIDDHKDDPQAIAMKSKEIFDFSFEGAVGVDLPVYRKLETVLEYAEPIHLLMNAIKLYDMTPELEQEIREVLRNKKAAMD